MKSELIKKLVNVGTKIEAYTIAGVIRGEVKEMYDNYMVIDDGAELIVVQYGAIKQLKLLR